MSIFTDDIDMLEKATHFEWITITNKKGTTFERRQKKKVVEAAHERTKEERLAAWNTSALNAGLKDKLVHSLKYNGTFYDTHGDPIFIPAEYADVIAETYDAKQLNDLTELYGDPKNKAERKNKDKLIATIKAKAVLYEKELEKKKKFHQDFVNSPAAVKNRIQSYTGAINKERSSVNDILATLLVVRAAVAAEIDPTVQIKYEGKLQEKPLSEVMERLEKAKASYIPEKLRVNTGIESLQIKHIEDYDDDDFTQHKFTLSAINHKDIVEKLNKKFNKKDDFKKALTDELGEDLSKALEDSDKYDFITIEKAYRGHLIKKTKLIHRGGKTFFATYYVNPRSGEISENLKTEGVTSYEGKHEEFATGDKIKFWNKKTGKYEFATVKKVVIDKKYPEGMLLVATETDPDVSVTLKSAKPIVKVGDYTIKIEDLHPGSTSISKPMEKPTFTASEPIIMDTSTEGMDILHDMHPDLIKTVMSAFKPVSLGGSSDVKLYSSETIGVGYAVKKPHKGDKAQLENEVLADSIYKLFGFRTPDSIIMDSATGPIKVSKYIKNAKELGSMGDSKKRLYEEVRKGFVLDALLGNWDVIGANEDNILFDMDSTIANGIVRVDNGGSFFYRARGGDKEFGPEIKELKTFLDEDTNPKTARVYAGLSADDIKKQAADILTKEGDLVSLVVKMKAPRAVSDALIRRLTWLRKAYGDGKTASALTAGIDLPVPEKKIDPDDDYDKDKYPSKATADYFKDWDSFELEGNPEIKDTIKQRILQFEKRNEPIYKEFAKSHGITVEEYKQRAQKKLNQEFEKSNFWRATDLKDLNKILIESKRFKSQFEVDRSHGSLDPESRSEAENEYFGFPDREGHERTLRPIYGYASDEKNGAINDTGKNPPPNRVGSYGRLTVKIKRDVALRKTTAIRGDSLGSSGSAVACPVAKPHFTMLQRDYDILSGPQSKTSQGFGRSYVECQYHNQLKLEDIDEILFSTKNFHSPDSEEAFLHMNSMIDIARKTDIKIRIY